MDQDLMTIEGELESRLFQNEDNGYAVVRVALEDGESCTAVGCIPCATPGERLTMVGKWTVHPSYGEQFAAERVERFLPDTEDALLAWLSSGALKGVGAATARRLVAAFGTDVFRVIQEEPERLARMRGITEEKALSLRDSLRYQLSLRRLLAFLGQYELALPVSVRLLRRFGDEALSVVERDPYLLTEEDLGVDFSKADAIAIDLGVPADDPVRVEAGVRFELRHNLRQGQVFLPRGKLIDASRRLLDMDADAVERALDALLAKGEVIGQTLAGEDACYLGELYRQEKETADCLRRMCATVPDRRVADPERLLRQMELESGIVYDEGQRQAVLGAAEHSVYLITGGPGTGKTTAIRAILALFGAMGLDTLLAAPTGRAAKRMSELCQAPAQTIHRMLEAKFENGRPAFERRAGNPLKTDAVIVDEMSMVDLPLFHALLEALPPHCRLVLVGDRHQLPSVGPGCVLDHLLRSGCIPATELTEIFRQSGDSAIILAAHAINRGETPRFSNARDTDAFLLRSRTPEEGAALVEQLCRTRLPDNMCIPADEIQVLTPTHRGLLGTRSLNQCLQEALNPPAEEKAEYVTAHGVFRVEDRVMQVRNNYDLPWLTDGGDVGAGVFNGDVGRILAIEGDGPEAVLTIRFDDRTAEYPAALLADLELAYAMTVHKSQGSEYRAVILALEDVPPALRTRGVLYTAVTRARELLIIVGDPAILDQMVHNDRPLRRYSGLRWRLVHEE